MPRRLQRFTARTRATITFGDAPFQLGRLMSLFEAAHRHLKTGFEGIGNEKQKALYKVASMQLRTAGANLEPIEPSKIPQPIFACHPLDRSGRRVYENKLSIGRVNQLSGQAPGDWPQHVPHSPLIPQWKKYPC